MVFLYIARPIDFSTNSFFWTRGIQLAGAKYVVFWGVTKIRIGKIVSAKMGKPENDRKISWLCTDTGPQKVALFVSLGQGNTLAG